MTEDTIELCIYVAAVIFTCLVPVFVEVVKKVGAAIEELKSANRYKKLQVENIELFNLLEQYGLALKYRALEVSNEIAPKQARIHYLRTKIETSTPIERIELYKEINKLTEEVTAKQDSLSIVLAVVRQELAPKIIELIANLPAKETALLVKYNNTAVYILKNNR